MRSLIRTSTVDFDLIVPLGASAETVSLQAVMNSTSPCSLRVPRTMVGARLRATFTANERLQSQRNRDRCGVCRTHDGWSRLVGEMAFDPLKAAWVTSKKTELKGG